MSMQLHEEHWTLVDAALAIARPLGATSALMGIVILFGYFAELEVLYRPIPAGPASNPLAALSFIFLGAGIHAAHYPQQSAWPKRLLTAVCIWICGSRLAEVAIGADLTSYMTPFLDVVQKEVQDGRTNSLGTNSAIMLITIGIALLLRSWNLYRLSQLVCALGLAMPVVSFIGYAYRLEYFYGQMSPLTATLGFVMGIATLALTAEHWGVRAILSPHIGGKLARIQVSVGVMIPCCLGYLMVRSLPVTDTSQSMMGSFVVAISWLIIFMVCGSAIYFEKADHARRQGEAKLAAAAQTDHLTGLPNRRMFFDQGQREVEHSRRSRRELWVLMMDLDRFKHINDTAGHAVGDQVLVAVAHHLAHSLRKVDMIGRLGGEEFAIILSETTREGCARVSESLREGISGLIIPGWTDIHGLVSVSIGCARLSGQEELADVLAVADKALYRAKTNGRNQVVFADAFGNSSATMTLQAT